MKLAICIPAYYDHLKYIPELFESISNQTKAPYLISISVSSVPINTELSIPKTLNNIPILVSQTHERKFAAANRNIAARAALEDNQVDGLAFIDVDDYMLPLYIEKVLEAFSEDTDVFLHNYFSWLGRKMSSREACNKAMISTPTVYHSYFKDEYKSSGYGQITPFNHLDQIIDIHNAHVSLKRFVFEREQFDEDDHFYRIEDCHFNYRLLKAGYNILVSTDQLSLYFC